MAYQLELRIRAVLDLPEDKSPEESEHELCTRFSDLPDMAAARTLLADMMPSINEITIEINTLPALRRRLLSGAPDGR